MQGGPRCCASRAPFDWGTQVAIKAVFLDIDGSSFADLLDRTEEAVAQVIEDMLAGRVEARPSSPKACVWCPAMNCERRQS